VIPLNVVNDIAIHISYFISCLSAAYFALQICLQLLDGVCEEDSGQRAKDRVYLEILLLVLIFMLISVLH